MRIVRRDGRTTSAVAWRKVTIWRELDSLHPRFGIVIRPHGGDVHIGRRSWRWYWQWMDERMQSHGDA